MYSLLQVGVAQLPSHVEADRPRHQLKDFLLSSYTDDEWYDRVPALLTDGGRSRRAFADKFLVDPTAHLPAAVICLWQDMTGCLIDVFVATQATEGERVDFVPCKGTVAHAIILLFTHHYEVGRWEVVTVNSCGVLPRDHPVVVELAGLHQAYVDSFRVDVRRAQPRSKLAGRVYDVIEHV